MKFCKKISVFFIASLLSATLAAQIIQVTSNDGGMGDGSLNSALQQALDGDTIDCSPIAGQTIYLSAPLPAIVQSVTSPPPSLTILGSGVTIDGGAIHPAFCLAQGAATITDFTIQNGLSRGGGGGSGLDGGGGGTAGGGALFVNSGSTMTICTLSLNNNQAIGGAGGAGNETGGAGGGGGGFGGGGGGTSTHTGASAGAGGGGGGNNGGAFGGNQGAGSPNTFSNYAGAGGGGEIATSARPAGFGGSVAATATTPSRIGGGGGMGSNTNGAGAGGGAGSGTSGQFGSDSIDNGGTGRGGAGGLGVGTENTYGAGGGGGGGNGGGAGYGTSGGGGGFNGMGGNGGALGGGGGASSRTAGGDGGFGAGGGAGHSGGVDIYGLGGAGGSAIGAPAGGGGGSGLGGAIFIQKGGVLIVQDGTSLSGNSTIAGMGGVAAGIGSSGGNGSSLGQDIFIQSGGSISFAINDALTLATPIEGAGFLSEVTGPGLSTSGIGTVNLMGSNTYLGGTLIQSGTLNLNGSIAGDVHIDSLGTFSGNATVNGNVYNNGTISPGNSIGQIVTTDLFLYPTSSYNVQVDSAGASDVITASGFAQIAGGVVVTPLDLTFTSPLTYTIITSGTGLTGQFSSLTSSVPALASISYDPLAVQLTYIPLSAIGLAGNALNAATCFATLAGPDAATLNNALLALNPAGITSAFEQMGPAQFSGPTEVQLLDAILVRSTYSKHLQKFSLLQQDRYCEQQPISLWSDGFAQYQKQGKQFGYRDTTLGATISADYCLRNWVVGAAFSATYDRFHWKQFAGKANIHSYYGGLYGRWNCDEFFYINAAILGALNRFRTTRHISFGTIDRHAHAHHNGNELLTNVGFEYWMCTSDLQLIFYSNLDYVLQHEHSYSETGAGSLDLQVNRKKSMLFQAEAGISLATTYSTCNGTFTPMLTLAYINQTPCSSKKYRANFVGSSCVFTGTGGNYKRNLFVPRLAFIYQDCCDSVNASIYYDGQIGKKYWAQDVVCDLTFRF